LGLILAAGFGAIQYLEKRCESRIRAVKNDLNFQQLSVQNSSRSQSTRQNLVSRESVIQVKNLTALDLQKALRLTGLYKGPLDGQLTREIVGAIKEFQRKNRLNPDGVVGNRTWRLLKTERSE
jgi:peptidoglycan hydrolase-like protein with peptidoglycan-binding domain